MQEDIISQIKKLKNISDVIVLTHNIDFIFLQTVFLSALKKCGFPSLTILADAQCAAESYKYQSSVITGLGKRFRVIPVAMNPGFRFHPKAILLSGEETAHLFIGSGNMTFGGIRENAEIWSRFDVNENGPNGEVSAFREYFQSILPFVGFADEVEKDIAEAFETANHPWVNNLTDASGLWYLPGSQDSLANTIVTTLSGVSVDRLTVCTPYFDKEAKALKQLSSGLGDPQTNVYIQSRKSTLLKDAAGNLPQNIKIKSIQAKKAKEPSSRFIHGKWYAIESGETVYFFHGSANCSNAALTGVQPYSNAELMIFSEMTRQEFEETVLDDLLISDESPELPDALDDSDTEEAKHYISIRSARLEFGFLKVAFSHSADVEITSLLVDSKPIAFESIGENEIIAKVLDRPSNVFLSGSIGDTNVTSDSMWIDDESSLRSNSATRTIIETIRDAQNDNGHDPKKWTMIFALLSKVTTQMSARELAGRAGSRVGKSTEGVKVSKDLLVSGAYSNVAALPTAKGFGTGSNTSIYSLLLQSFGITGLSQVEETKPPQDPPENAGSDGEEGGDLPETVPTVTVKRVLLAKPTGREIERLTKNAKLIVERICDPEFLSIRDPQRLSLDLQVIGLLLRKAYSMGWVDKQVYFELSHKVWSNLFFHSEENPGKGWLQVRFERAEDQNQFVSLFVSPMLTASLYAWFSAVPLDSKSVYSQRFVLSQIMAMGRCPWLWLHDEDENQKVTEDLVKIWKDSPCGKQTSETIDQAFSEFSEQINGYGEIGLSLTLMESELSNFDIKVIRESVESTNTNSGEILWQGSKGICIGLQSTRDRKRVEVLCLQEPEKVSDFMVDFLIPMKGLLECDQLFSEDFRSSNRPILHSFIDSTLN